MMKIHHSCITLFLLLSLSAFTQTVTVTASSDKTRIVIGEQIKLTLEATVPRQEDIDWPKIDSLPHFEILNASKLDSQLSGEELILKQTLTLTSWDSGRWQIPAFAIVGARRTKPITIDVGFSPFDRNQPYHDIKDIIDVDRPRISYWYWYLIGAVLLIVFLLLLFPPKKKKPEVAAFVPDEGIYKQSLNRLDKLRGAADGDPKVFHTELVDIFREYLLKRKGIQSYSKTTDDLGVQLGGLPIPKTVYNSLLQTLRLSDLVKFARFRPTVEENKTAVDNIKQSITTIEDLK
ncbi:MAG TPA: BatD family protein [Chitinophagaceae bacterium]